MKARYEYVQFQRLEAPTPILLNDGLSFNNINNTEYHPFPCSWVVEWGGLMFTHAGEILFFHLLSL